MSVESKPEDKTEIKTDLETEVKTDKVRTEVKIEDKDEVKNEVKTEGATQVEVEVKAEVEIEPAAAEVKTKQTFRKKIWVSMAEKNLSNSFRSLCCKIPYFKGSSETTQRLSELDQFKEAKLLMVSPDKPQESVIILSLQNKKEVLIPRPRLLDGLFCHVKNADSLPEDKVQNAVTRRSIKQVETLVGFGTPDLKVDMLVLGSVCVNKSGYRIGDGEGFADLEYAILSKMKAIYENTIVVTTVHDCQVLDDIPNDLFEPHDVPVDIIVTPTQTIIVNPKLKKPSDIIWSAVSNRKLEAIPVLKEIKGFDEKNGETLSLKEDDSDVESKIQHRKSVKKDILKLRSKLSKRVISDTQENDKSKEQRRRPFIRRRRLRRSKTENDENAGNQSLNQSNSKPKPQRYRSNLSRNHQVDFSLRLSNIASTVRVRDLKSALLERGVKPSNITWRGQRGFCYLHFGKLRKNSNTQDQPVQVDSIVSNLKDLKIGENGITNENPFIIVEPAEPVTRIEVTDVSSV